MAYFTRALAALAAAVTLAGCSGVSSPSTLTSQDYTDTISTGGQAFQTFSVNKTGEMQLSLLSLTPRPVVGFLGAAVGLTNGSACLPLNGFAVSQMAVGQSYSFPSITKGNYCMVVGDFNSILPGSATFTLRYSHP